MRFSRLYFKMFLAFLGVLITAEVMVFGYILYEGPPPPFLRHLEENTSTAEELIRREMKNAPDFTTGATAVSELLHILARGYDGELWLTRTNGAIVAASFDGPAPDLLEQLEPIKEPIAPQINVYKVEEGDFRAIYLESPIILDDGSTLDLHYYLHARPHKEETWFFKGLILLTILSAVFIFPVSRKITRPILKLTRAADSLGHGDFSKRVPIKGKDEVAVLANKFNKMADSIEKMVGTGKELTAHLSHALRTPLARMRISLQMLLEQHETGSGVNPERLLEKIRNEIEIMDKTIGHILDLSKLDMQGPQPRTDTVDVSKRLLSLLDKYEPMVEHNGFRLETNLVPTPPLPCNAHSIDVLLDSVLSNAMKYTDEGGTIRVEAFPAGEETVIRICNTHPELSEKELADMMIPFNRLKRGSQPGTGLGLAIAEKVASIHGGSITAKHEEDSVCLTIRLSSEV